MLALAEGVAAPSRYPSGRRSSTRVGSRLPVYRWLRSQPAGTPVVHLPMLDVYGLERRAAFHESVYMVYSTHHWLPLVNGYAGIEPAEYRRYRELGRSFPSEEFLSAMRGIGVRYVVLHRAVTVPTSGRASRRRCPRPSSGRIREVAPFSGDTVFEILPAAAR